MVGKIPGPWPFSVDTLPIIDMKSKSLASTLQIRTVSVFWPMHRWQGTCSHVILTCSGSSSQPFGIAGGAAKLRGLVGRWPFVNGSKWWWLRFNKAYQQINGALPRQWMSLLLWLYQSFTQHTQGYSDSYLRWLTWQNSWKVLYQQPFQEGSRDLQKGYPSVTKGASSSAKHPSKVPFTKAWRGLHLRKASKGFEEIWRGLEGGLKGASRGLDLEGGLKGVSRELEAFNAEGGFEGVWRGLKWGFKGAWSLQRWRRLWGGLKGVSRVCCWCTPCSKCYGMDCFATYFTHVQTCNVTRVQSATEWTALVHTLHMFKAVM